jgi:hypothetical protein
MANGQVATQPTTQPTTQPAPQSTVQPTVQPTDGGIQWTANPALQTQTDAPPSGSIQWTPNPDTSQTTKPQGDFSPEAFANHPVLTQLHRGFETGFQHGLGLTAPNPEDPHSLGISEMASQTWNNLKQSAIHSYHALGGTAPGEEKWDKAPIYRLDIPVMSALATVGTPFDMIGMGINSMASTLEDGMKDIKAGVETHDHERMARGGGKIFASLGQIAMGAEKGVAGEVADRATQAAGEAMSKRALVPGRSLLRATGRTSYLYGKDVGKVFTEEPIKPTFSVENLKDQIVTIQNRVAQQVRSELSDPAVSQPTINTTQIIDDAINQQLQSLTKESGLKNRQAVVDAVKKVRDDVVHQYDADGNMVGSLRNQMQTPLEVDAVKRSIGRNTRWEADPELEQYANSARKAMYGSLNDAIETTVDRAKPGTSVKALNARYANLIEAERLIRERLRKEEGTELGLRRLLSRGEFWTGVTSLLTGTGLLQSGVGGEAGLGAAVGGGALLADRAIRSTPGRIMRAKGGAMAGQVLQSTAKADVPSMAVRGATAAAAIGAQAAQKDSGEAESAPTQDAGPIAQAKPTADDQDTSDWQHITTSDGRSWKIHPEDLPEAKRRDPKLKIH